jgi:hypothetical protein
MELNEHTLKNDGDAHKISAAKSTTAALKRAFKAYLLYNHAHPNTQQANTLFHKQLVSFVEEYSEFVIEVTKEHLLCDEEAVYSLTPNDEDFIKVLFRDGVKWLTFSHGITADETALFIKLLCQYKSISDDAEDDFVTAFWESACPNITLQALDNFLDNNAEHHTLETMHTIGSGANTGEPSHNRDLPPVQNTPSNPAANNNPPVTDHVIERADDTAGAQPGHKDTPPTIKMIDAQGETDATNEVLDILIELIAEQQLEDYAPVALEFLREILDASFKNKLFGISLKIVKGLEHIGALAQDEQSVCSKAAAMLSSVYTSDSFKYMHEGWETGDREQLELIKQILLTMQPEAVRALIPLLPDVQSRPAHIMLTDVIKQLAQKDLRPIAAALNKADERIAKHMVNIIIDVAGDSNVELLLSLTRFKTDETAGKVLKFLVSKNIWVPDKVFSLMESESTPLRLSLIAYLGSRKCPIAEGLLINYLKTNKLRRAAERDLYLACCKALGLCGTDRALQYLREILLHGGLISKFKQSKIRQGAIIALQNIGTDESEKLIEQAARSFFPGIRVDYRLAISGIKI